MNLYLGKPQDRSRKLTLLLCFLFICIFSIQARYHSKSGPLKVNEQPYRGMVDYFIKGAEELGVPYTDLNAEYASGVMPLYLTQENGRRCGTNKAFIEPARKQGRLTVHKYSHVTKVLLDGPENRAIGVEYIRHGVKRQAFSTKEVIISAGSLNSPHILMHSGIGPRDQLEKFNVIHFVLLTSRRMLPSHCQTLWCRRYFN